MFKAHRLFSATALVASAVSPALAQTATTPTAQAATARPAQDPNEIICQKQEETGSRLVKKKVCMTRAEWADRQLQDRQELERAQTRRGMKGD
jgi:invasion protein IalB